MSEKFDRLFLLMSVAVLVNLACVNWSKADSPKGPDVHRTVDKLKGTKIISIQDTDKINAIDQEGMSGVWGNSPVNEYDRHYSGRLKRYLGIDLILVRSSELLGEMDKVTQREQEELADL